jgi:hypothetical protein
MNDESFKKYLTDRYKDQVSWYDRKAVHNQKKYRWMQWWLIVLAALTPILIELNLPKLFGSSGDLATITAAVVAILTAGLKTFKYQENWINYRTTCETLRKEEHYYAAGIGEYNALEKDEDRRALFVERVENLISRENTMWLSGQKSEKRKGGTADQAGRD